MKQLLLFVFIAIVTSIASINAQETEIFYPTLNDSVEAPGYTIVDVNMPAALIGSNFWWDKKASTRTPPSSDIYEFGYEQDTLSWAHRIRGYDKNNYYTCETWFIIDAVDLSDYTNAKLTFFNNAEFAVGSEDSPWLANLDIMMSSDYTNDLGAANWTKYNEQCDTLDQRLDYDGEWVKSTLDLVDYLGKSKVSLAFKYTIGSTGSVDKETERPGGFRIAEVRFTGTKTATSIAEKQFDDQINIYPNPTSDQIYFSSEPQSVAIYSITGKRMNLNHIVGRQMDVSALANGIYIVKVATGNQVRSIKLIKE